MLAFLQLGLNINITTLEVPKHSIQARDCGVCEVTFSPYTDKIKVLCRQVRGTGVDSNKKGEENFDAGNGFLPVPTLAFVLGREKSGIQEQ